MIGLFNVALQTFVVDQHGSLAWASVLEKAGMPEASFEPLLDYRSETMERIVEKAAEEFGCTQEELLEDFGTYLVTSETHATLRRLLRFSGATFREFIGALDELPARGRLALDSLRLPEIDVREVSSGVFEIGRSGRLGPMLDVLHGAIRGMADDYGALVTISVEPNGAGVRTLRLVLHQAHFTTGRQFDIAQAG